MSEKMKKREIKRESTIKKYSVFDTKLYSNYNILYFIKNAEEINAEAKTLYNTLFKLYQALDALNLFYFDKDVLKYYLKKDLDTIWSKIIKKFMETNEYKEINRITQGNVVLSKALALKFLYNVLLQYGLNVNELNKKFDEVDERTKNKVNEILNNINDLAREIKSDLDKMNEIYNMVQNARANLKEILKVVKSSNESVEKILQKLTYSRSYSLDSLSLIQLSSHYEDIRYKLSRIEKISKLIRLITKKFEIEMSKFGKEFEFGIIRDVELMKSYSDIKYILKSQFALPKEIFYYKFANKELLKKSFSAKQQFIIYIDKSGSMQEEITNKMNINVSKFDACCAIALSLMKYYKIKIKLFDTEVFDVPEKGVLTYLLKTLPDYGTNIQNILEDIKENNYKDTVIVLTDGISEVNEDFAKQIAKKFKVFFILIPPCDEREWLRYFKYYKINSLEELIHSTKKIVLK